MAQWWEIGGVKVAPGTPGAVFHDTDLLAYGDQGDTRYWEGKPGAVGSVTYDRPKDQPGAQPTAVVVSSGMPDEPPVAESIGTGELVAITGSGFVPVDALSSPGATPTTQPEMVETCAGRFTVESLRDQLRKAGYPGPWDIPSMVAAYNRAACPQAPAVSSPVSGTGTAGSSYTALGSTGKAVTTAPDGTDTMARIQAWVAANPIPALLIAAVAGSMLLGGRRRW